MSKKIEFEHGGARNNSGRKAQFNEPTKVIRVPESQVNFIKNWLLKNFKTSPLNDLTSSIKIQTVQPNTTRIYQIPLATERVAAGTPSAAQDSIEQSLDMNEYLIKNEGSTFIVKANSLSMLDVGIDIDDPLVVDRSIPAKSGDIVIALIDTDFTVKRLMIDKQFNPPKIWLKAENEDYQNIYIEEGQELIIWGVVTYNLKKMY
ncbi:LexA family protein [Acinetobacter sp. ANC 3832]|uniref:LexA family protein n=1 Tax=Acinetobacter sp. ANC 3832 TaxID=1977874 RepID=UPI000A349817|nr:translesion error-prone DNA polymerase V autoproteolytic subunit [Acinetobacter sp. ANC 3832]OTG89235.1 DNA polymerase V [Acinetobacter sp. ANC 3832]